MTAGWTVSRASPSVVYIDAPLKRSNFGPGAEVAPFLPMFTGVFLLKCMNA
jgi:hypothetical protein